MKIQLKKNEIIVLRTANSQRQSRGGFQYPELGRVIAPDWDSEEKCGGGLHALPWGVGDYSLLDKVEAHWEPLDSLISMPEYGRLELAKEGFPDIDPREFIVAPIAGEAGNTRLFPNYPHVRYNYHYI